MTMAGCQSAAWYLSLLYLFKVACCLSETAILLKKLTFPGSGKAVGQPGDACFFGKYSLVRILFSRSFPNHIWKAIFLATKDQGPVKMFAKL